MCEDCCYFDGQCEFGENKYSLYPGECKQFSPAFAEEGWEEETK